MMARLDVLSTAGLGRLASRGQQDTDDQRGRVEYEAILVWSGSSQ
jgi:hypothetical protein